MLTKYGFAEHKCILLIKQKFKMGNVKILVLYVVKYVKHCFVKLSNVKSM